MDNPKNDETQTENELSTQIELKEENIEIERDATILTEIPKDEENFFEKLISKPKEVQKDSTLKYFSMLIFALLNFVYSLVEIIFSTKLFTGSLSLLGDGVHNFSDVLALAVAFWADKASKNKGSNTYTYGMVRGELIGGLVNSVFLLSTAIFIILESIPKFFNPEKIEKSLAVLIIAAIGVVINLAATVIFGIFGCGHGHSHAGGHGHHDEEKKHGHPHENHHGHSHENKHGHSHENHHKDSHDHDEHKDSHDHENHHRHSHDQDHDDTVEHHPHDKKDSLCKRISKNINMCGVFLHFLGDTLTSVVVVITGALNIAFPDSVWVRYVDPVCSLLIVAILIWTSVPLIIYCIKILLQKVPDDMNVGAIQNDLVSQIDIIIEIHDFHVWQLVDSVNVCTMHVILSEENASQFGRVSSKIHEILHGYGIHNSTIQPEFISKKLLEKLRQNNPIVDENSSKTPLLSIVNGSCRCLDDCEEETCCDKENGVTKK